MITENHPIYFVKNIFKDKTALLSFSKYSYVSDSLLDCREVFSLPSSSLSVDWLELQLQALDVGQELAINSEVYIGGRKKHLPLIDFSISHWDASFVLRRMQQIIPKKIINNLAIYDSGRSFHGYSQVLLTPKDWFNYMGRLLLVNPPGGKEIIDSRWVGHRVIGGYCALRWSSNTDQYIKEPKRIKFP
tara:strand:- start:977 stop:1543 length:567 start_codon:yes stop_codon:yes gene_type:complete